MNRLFTSSRLLFSGVLCAAFVFSLLASPVLARPDMAEQNAATRFAAMDGDKDGGLTREEFFAAHPQMKEAAFDAIDNDKDGRITLPEWEGFASGHGKDTHGSGMPPHSGKAPGEAPALIMPPKK